MGGEAGYRAKRMRRGQSRRQAALLGGGAPADGGVGFGWRWEAKWWDAKGMGEEGEGIGLLEGRMIVKEV